MICRHCGADIPDDQMVCPRCGAEVQIVPDYNPLDDVLAREVKGSVEGATRQIQTDDIRRYRRGSSSQNVNATRVLSPGEMDRIRRDRRYGEQMQIKGAETQTSCADSGRQPEMFSIHGRVQARCDVPVRVPGI